MKSHSSTAFLLLVLWSGVVDGARLRRERSGGTSKVVANITSLLELSGCSMPVAGEEDFLDPGDADLLKHLLEMSDKKSQTETKETQESTSSTVPTDTAASLQKALDQLNDAHKGQQKLVDESFKQFNKCDSDFAVLPGSQTLKRSQEQFDAKIQPHEACRTAELAAKIQPHEACRTAELAAKTASDSCFVENKRLKDVLDKEIDKRKLIESSFNNQCNWCSPTASDQSNWGDFFKRGEMAFKKYHLEWTAADSLVTQAQTAYDTQNGKCTTLQANHGKKTAECDGKMRALETLACTLRDEQRVMCKTTHSCFDAAKTNYENVVAQAQKETLAFKNSWKGHSKLKCIAENMPAVSMNPSTPCPQVANCLTKVPDVTHLDIKVTTIPTPSQCDAKYIQDPCSAEYSQRVYVGIDPSVLPACKSCPQAQSCALALKTNGDATFGYSSAYWTNSNLLNENSDPTQAGNAKYAAFNNVAFTGVTMCVGAPTGNCVEHTFSSSYKSMVALFSSGYIRDTTVDQQGILKAFGPIAGSYQKCGMQRPGFNIQCNDNNKARWGYCNNCASQSCQEGDSNDADSAIGIGLAGQSTPREMGAGWTNYFASGAGTCSPNSMTAKNVWFYAGQCSKAATTTTTTLACVWTSHSGKYSGGHAAGHSTKYDLDRAQAKCLELGSKCQAVTCASSGTCTVRASSGLSGSPSGETTYVPAAECRQAYQALSNVNGGCWNIPTEAACLAAKDGRRGQSYSDSPCQWCCGLACTTNNANKCEPQEWLFRQGNYVGKSKNGLGQSTC